MESTEPVSDPLPPAPAPATFPTWSAMLRACVPALVGYLLTVAASVVIGLILVFAVGSNSDGSAPAETAEDVDLQAIGNLVGLPFQLVGMALGGSLQISADDGSLALLFPPLLVTAIFAVAVFTLTKRRELADPSTSSTERVVLATAAGLGTAVVVTVLTRALAMRDGSDVIHAASLSLFLGTALVTAGASWAGRRAAVGQLWPRWLRPEGRRAAHLVTQHLAFELCVILLVVLVWLLINSEIGAVPVALVWGPNLALMGLSLGHLGAISVGGVNLFAWDLAGWVTPVLLAVAIVGAVLASIAWHLRRDRGPASMAAPTSWIWLPATYALTGLVVCLAAATRTSGSVDGWSGGAWVHPAFWFVAVFAVWGGLVEVLSRALAPSLVGAIPARLRPRFERGPANTEPVAAAQRLPMPPDDRRRARTSAIALGIAAGVGVAGLVTVKIVGSQFYGPEAGVEEYLDAVVAGETEKAFELAPTDDQSSGARVTEEILAASAERITGYTITDVERDGDTATVTVDLQGLSSDSEVELSLVASGSKAMLFDGWKVTDGGLAAQVTIPVPESSQALEINGVSVPSTPGADLTFWAFPGSYAIDPFAGNQWLAAPSAPTVVSAANAGVWGMGVYAEVATPEPSDELKKQVDAAIDELVTGCMASDELDPKDCPQSAYGYGDVRAVRWTLTTMPTVSWDAFDGSFPAELWSDDSGEAQVSYEYDASYGYGAPDWTKETDTSSLYVSATVDVVDSTVTVSFDSF